MKKNTKIILAVLGILLVLLIVLLNIYSTKKAQEAKNAGTTPTPTLGIYPTLSVKDQIKTQQESDVYTGQLKAESEKLYPWQDKLPIQTTEYFIYFDEDKKKFIAKIYLKNRTIDVVKNEVVAELQQQEFPLNTYPIEWMVK
jgi:hypothetical protein